MKRIVTLGGGTGTFVVLSGLRHLPEVSLTAIVSAADDGGSTGRLRDAYGFLPPGDVRQALVALAEDGNRLRDLFTYRFLKGDVAGHSLGNLFITALTDLTGNSVAALQEAGKILRIQGTVVPSTEEAATLHARFNDGEELSGQLAISGAGSSHGGVAELSLEKPLPLTLDAAKALAVADIIILGPGCLYSSTIASLLAEGTKEAIRNSPAKIVYLSNLFTKAGETEGYTIRDHVREIARYAGREPDVIFIHQGDFAPDIIEWYAKGGEEVLEDDMGDDARVTRLPLASSYVVPPLPEDPLRRSLMRHDSSKLAEAIATIL